ncbi:hypothetical protein SMC26_38640 [Actinomadura fulvescens]|uniref:hypothetical protein n=1 Tax=Actinomadura fulvescens TaxID=46160 RepID=UPI0031DECD4A
MISLALTFTLALVLLPWGTAAASAEGLQVLPLIARNPQGHWMSHFDVPFHVDADVAHDRPVERVELRLSRAGTGEVVATTSMNWAYDNGGISSYMSPSMDPPVGDYEAVVTAWDDQGRSAVSPAYRVRKRLNASLVDIAHDRDWIDVDHARVTFTGRLVHKSSDGSQHPLSGFVVEHQSGERTETGADGRFSLTARTTSSTVAIATLARGQYRGDVAWLTLELRRRPVRLSVTDSETRRVGDKATVAGRLERRDAGGAWRPLGARPVKIYFIGGESATPVAQAQTDDDGRYSAQVHMPGTGRWDVRFGEVQYDSWYEPATAGTAVRNVQHPTVIRNLDVGPEPVTAGSRVTAKGEVARPMADGAQAMVVGGPVVLQFSTTGHTWSDLTKGRTDAHGRFFLHGVARRTGHWRVAYTGGTEGNASPTTPDAAVTSWADRVDVKYRTAFASLNASPEPVRKGRTLTVSGRLNRLVGSWKPAGGATVYVYFKAKGSSKWTRMAVVKTGRGGWFRKGFKASRDGTWLATYKGGLTDLGVWSPSDYVDVR